MKNGFIKSHQLIGKFAQAIVKYPDGSEMLINLTATSLHRRLLLEKLLAKGNDVADLESYAQAVIAEKEQDDGMDEG